VHDALVIVSHIQGIHFPDSVTEKVVHCIRPDIVPLNSDIEKVMAHAEYMLT